MKKSILRYACLVVALFSLIVLFVQAQADSMPETVNLKIVLDGKTLVLKNKEGKQQDSIIIDDKIYVPIEELIQAMGGKYEYSETEKKINLTLSKSTKNNSKDSKTSNIVGVWKCKIKGGISTLTINKGGNASLNVGSNTYKCKWKLSGSKLTLTQNGRPITGTYNGTTIDLSFAGIRMLFKR